MRFATLLLLGCPEPTSEPTGCGAPTIALGTGVDVFQPLEEGDEVVLVHGPQGGYHVTAALRLCGVAQPVKLHYTIALEADGLQVADVLYERAGIPTADPCCVEVLDLTGFVFVVGDTGGIVDPPDLLLGERVKIEITVEDPKGVVGVAGGTFVVVEA